jgi:hypothetical protein
VTTKEARLIESAQAWSDRCLAAEERVRELEKQLDSVEEYAWDWYHAGFEESGEGWNGEFPLSDKPDEAAEVEVELRKRFAERYVAHHAPRAGDGEG